MPDGWGTAFAQDFFARQSPLDGAAHFAALVGQRQTERRLQAVAADREYQIEQNMLLWSDLERFAAHGQDLAAESVSLREYIGRLSQEVAALRLNEIIYRQEGVELRAYNNRLLEENAALGQWGDQLCEEKAALREEVDDLLEKDT